jgi:hypothetical protein
LLSLGIETNSVKAGQCSLPERAVDSIAKTANEGSERIFMNEFFDESGESITTSNIVETVNADDSEKIEGYEDPSDSDLGDYPLDQVFVRSELRTVGDVVRRIKAGRYDLNPDFQRDFVWDVVKQSRLIESCLMRIPLPVFYVAEALDGRIVVVDGLQRLTTFKSFLDGGFKLLFSRVQDPEDKRSELTGKFFKELQLNFQERLEDTQLTLYILDAKAPDRAKLDIFERVNSGETLTRQQMRNCLFNGEATQWLRDAAKSEHFVTATGGSLDSKKMRDREAINRFCAFTLLGVGEYRGDMDSFLARSLNKMNELSKRELSKLRDSFDQSMENNEMLFKHHAFRKSAGGADYSARSVLNIAFFDVCSVIFQSLSYEQVETNQARIRTAVRVLLKDADFVRAITYSTNSTRAIKERFQRMNELMKEVLL